jgi:hypothetical protein
VRTFYGAWIGANAFAEALGLGTTVVLGWRVGPELARLSGFTSALSAGLLAVVLGTVLEGVVVGVAQELVLRRRLTQLRPRSWIVATAIGAALAWVLGMVPSTVMALTSSESASQSSAEPSVLVTIVLAVGLGLVAGPILGIAQWTVLRRLVQRAGRWLWANALAWAVGMPLIFLGMDLVPWTGQPLVAAVAIYAVCAIAGAVVGVIHGRILVQLLRGVSSPLP